VQVWVVAVFIILGVMSSRSCKSCMIWRMGNPKDLTAPKDRKDPKLELRSESPVHSLLRVEFAHNQK